MGSAVSMRNEMALYLQGALVQAAEAITSGDKALFVQPVLVQQPVDEAGEVEPYFRVLLASGVCLLVRVEVEHE